MTDEKRKDSTGVFDATKYTPDKLREMATAYVSREIRICEGQLRLPITQETRDAMHQQLGEWRARQDLLQLGNDPNAPNLDLTDGIKVDNAKKLLRGQGITDEAIIDWAESWVNQVILK